MAKPKSDSRAVGLLPAVRGTKKKKPWGKTGVAPPPRPPVLPPQPGAGAKAKAKPLEEAVGKKPKKLRGFAYMKVHNPARLHHISTIAGMRAQQKHGDDIRWDSKTAKKMAVRGGLARWGRYETEPESAT